MGSVPMTLRASSSSWGAGSGMEMGRGTNCGVESAGRAGGSATQPPERAGPSGSAEPGVLAAAAAGAARPGPAAAQRGEAAREAQRGPAGPARAGRSGGVPARSKSSAHSFLQPARPGAVWGGGRDAPARCRGSRRHSAGSVL